MRDNSWRRLGLHHFSFLSCRMLDSCIFFLAVTSKLRQKMTELCTEYLFLTFILRRRKKMDRFCNLSLFMIVSWRMCFDSLFLAICISPMGLESGEIKDEALSHSLPSSHLSKPSFIRLNGFVRSYPFGWQARIAQTPPDYLQVTRPTIYFVIWHKCLC